MAEDAAREYPDLPRARMRSSSSGRREKSSYLKYEKAALRWLGRYLHEGRSRPSQAARGSDRELGAGRGVEAPAGAALTPLATTLTRGSRAHREPTTAGVGEQDV